MRNKRGQGAVALSNLFLIGLIIIVIIVGTFLVGIIKDGNQEDLFPSDEVIDWEGGFLALSLATTPIEGTTVIEYLDSDNPDEQLLAAKLTEFLSRTELLLTERPKAKPVRYVRVILVAKGRVLVCDGQDADIFCSGAESIGRISVDEWIKRSIPLRQEAGGSVGYVVSPSSPRSAIIVTVSPDSLVVSTGRGQNPTGGVM